MIINSSAYQVIDIILFLVCALTLLRSYQKGFFRILYDILAILVSFYVAFQSYDTWASAHQVLDDSLMNDVFWMIALYLGMRLITGVVRLLIPSLKKTNPLSVINHLLGLAVGVLKVIIILELVSRVLTSALFQNGEDYVDQSVIYNAKERIQTISHETNQ